MRMLESGGEDEYDDLDMRILLKRKLRMRIVKEQREECETMTTGVVCDKKVKEEPEAENVGEI